MNNAQNELLENGERLSLLIRKYMESKENAHEVFSCLRDSKVWVLIPNPPKDFSNNQVSTLTPDVLQSSKTQEKMIPIFSQPEQIPPDYSKGNRAILHTPFLVVCEMLDRYADVSNIIINPFIDNLVLSKNFINMIYPKHLRTS